MSTDMITLGLGLLATGAVALSCECLGATLVLCGIPQSLRDRFGDAVNDLIQPKKK